MTEPTNPLFEDEKEFLERKKLEYERALRGDVEEIKEQTVQVGKVALVGAGVVGGIWLLVKAFSSSKPKHKSRKKHKKHRQDDDYGYDGYDGYEEFDENDQELTDLAAGYQEDPEYAYEHATGYVDDATEDGFSYEDEADDYVQEDDDNGLGQYPDFPAHSSATHGDDDDEASETADGYQVDEAQDSDDSAPQPYASANSYQARPYDDSRLPDSDSFAEADGFTDIGQVEAAAPSAPEPKRSAVGHALLAFIKSETGRVITAQAAALALALVTKAVQGILPKYEAEANKNSDLAASSTTEGISPAAWPATSASQDVSAAASHDDKPTPREPLA